MNHTVIRLRHLFAGADEGYFTLPVQVIEARTAAEVLKQAAVAPQRGNEEELAVKLADAAAKGKLPAGWQDELRPRTLAAEYHNAAASVLRAARDRVDDRVLSVTLDLADTILAEHLRPKLDEAVALVRPHADDATDLPWGVPTRMFAPEYAPVVDALGKGAAIYFAVRRGQSVLREARGVPEDEAHLYFGEFRSGIRSHWPTYRTQRQTRPPWDNLEGPARFAWLVANMPDDLWMPTADECDDAYRTAVESSRLRPSPVG
jgi:hypothetical protein